MHILLVEDDADMRASLARALTRRGMQVSLCADGVQAAIQWHKLQPDAVVLDLSLPGQDGLQLLECMRAQHITTPVLILTARGTVGDRVLGLNAGADDYLAKPFDLDELEARLRALLRRVPQTQARSDTLPDTVLGTLRMDHSSGAIYHLGELMDLTPRERALMQALLVRPGQALAKERLYELVFPGELDVKYEAIEVVVYRLRKKISGTGADLVTLRGLGYLLKPASPTL
jgi:two-component system, OmpR family, response regulator TctD